MPESPQASRHLCENLDTAEHMRRKQGTGSDLCRVVRIVDLTVTDKTEVLTESTEQERQREFEDLVRRHHGTAFNVAYRIAGNRTDAEDLVQETFLRAFRFYANYRRDYPFESWLYKIMSNLWIDTLRRRPKAGTPISLDQPVGADEQTLDLPDDGPTPEVSLLEGTLDSRVQDALNALPKAFRVAVILADIEGMSYEEIAEVMRCSIGTVRSRIHRGRRAMRQKLGSLEEFLNEVS